MCMTLTFSLEAPALVLGRSRASGSYSIDVAALYSAVAVRSGRSLDEANEDRLPHLIRLVPRITSPWMKSVHIYADIAH